MPGSRLARVALLAAAVPLALLLAAWKREDDRCGEAARIAVLHALADDARLAPAARRLPGICDEADPLAEISVGIAREGHPHEAALLAREAARREPDSYRAWAALSIVLMDADLSDDPSEITMLIRPIVEEDFEFVLGSRLLGKREKGSLTPVQVFGSFIASLMIRMIFGIRYTDMGPFRAIKRTTLESLGMREATYGWSIEMQTKAAARKLRIKEVPVSWRNRAGGESKVAGTISGSIRAGFRIVMTILRTAINEAKG